MVSQGKPLRRRREVGIGQPIAGEPVPRAVDLDERLLRHRLDRVAPEADDPAELALAHGAAVAVGGMR